jgi:hypothetical protein
MWTKNSMASGCCFITKILTLLMDMAIQPRIVVAMSKRAMPVMLAANFKGELADTILMGLNIFSEKKQVGAV